MSEKRRSTNLKEGKQMDDSWEGLGIHQVPKKMGIVAGIENGQNSH